MIKFMDRPTILIVDDDRLNRAVLAELLQAEYTVLLAKNGARGVELAQHYADEIRLILLDVSMPGMSGYDVLSILKADQRTSGLTVVFITAQSEDSDEEHGLRLGAADYVHKPVRPAIVSARIRNLVKLAEQKRALERLVQLDGLTGIANRRHFDQAFDLACRHSARADEPIGLVLIDIDHFKLFNDQYGHVAGDDALRQVAQSLERCVRRPYDLAARYGGEEFVLLTPYGRGVRELAEGFHRCVMELAIPHPASPSAICLTVSCGAVLSRCDRSETGERILRQADKLLYEAKAEGRNRVKFAECLSIG